MNINATLIGQMITFMVLVFVTMKYIWPPVIRALENRRKQIAEGLEAGERGRHELELAQKKIREQFREAKQQANHILDQANQRAIKIVDEAREKAREEGLRMINVARDQINQEVESAKQELLKQIGSMAVIGVEKILKKKVDESVNNRLVDQLIEEI